MHVAQMQRIRDALEAWRRAEAGERVARWRATADARSATQVAAEHRWIASADAVEALREAARQGQCTPQEAAAARAHLARAAAEQELAAARDALASLADGTVEVEGRPFEARALLERWASEPDARFRAAGAQALDRLAAGVVTQLDDAYDRAAERVMEQLSDASPHADTGDDASALAERARGWLEQTDDAADQILDRLGVAHDRGRLEDLLHALRAPDLDGAFERGERWRRVAEPLRQIGFEHDMTARMAAERGHRGLDPRAHVAPRAVPHDLRLAQAPAEHGVWSELTAAHAVGRGVALALVAPALPVELRRPIIGTVSRAMGALHAQLLTEPAFLRRARALADRERHRASDIASALIVLSTRLEAAAVLARPSDWGAVERTQLAGELAGRALRVETPPRLAAVWLLPRASAGARFRASTCALALWLALRERYDEDWYRNPRAAEPLRAACHRGGLLPVEAWCTELGAEPRRAPDRLRDWLAAR